MRVTEQDAVFGQAINVGRVNARPAAEARCPVIQVVDSNKKNVGTLRIWRGRLIVGRPCGCGNEASEQHEDLAR